MRRGDSLQVRPAKNFVVDATEPKDITVHGNWTKGFFVQFKDVPVELGPFADPQTAVMHADRYAAVLERAN